MNQYMLAFSSYYKAAYAQEKLYRAGIRGQMGKTPPNLLKTCGYSLYMTTVDIRYVLQILGENDVSYRAVYRVVRENGEYSYNLITMR